MRILSVSDGFPRLTPAGVPFGVTKVSYEIDLDKVSGDGLSIEVVLKELGVN
jgi:hypothetical protein